MKHLYILLLPLLIMNSMCKKLDNATGNRQNNQTSESAEYPIKNDDVPPVANNASQGNDVSIFGYKEGEKFIKYISWEDVIWFINYERFILHTHDRMTGNSDEYNGTYNLNIQDNVTFLEVHFDGGASERWLMLANGTVCDIYKPDGKHIHGVTGSVNREEIIGTAGNDVRASSYLVENGISYLPENLKNYYKTDKPWATRGYGINEKLFFENGYSNNGGYIHISIGYVSYDKPYLYNQNSRPKTIRLSVENKFSIIIDLRDTPHYQEIKLPSDITRDDILILEILDVYPGTKYEDTCINTIFFETSRVSYQDNDYWDY